MPTTKARNQGDDGQDVEGHGRRLRGPESAQQPGEPDGSRRSRETEDDTEGHQFLPNEALSRNAAAGREREIQRSLQQRDLATESRRPFFRRRKSS